MRGDRLEALVIVGVTMGLRPSVTPEAGVPGNGADRSWAGLAGAVGGRATGVHDDGGDAGRCVEPEAVPPTRVREVPDLLGHDGTRMVAQVYRHAVAPTVDVAAARMERLLGGKGGDNGAPLAPHLAPLDAPNTPENDADQG
jgi:hypothetical protein